MNNKTKITNIKFGEKLKELRTSREMSQKVLANFLGVNANHISQIEGGRRFVTLDTLVAISEILNYPIKDFFDFNDIEKPTDDERKLDGLVRKLKQRPRKIKDVCGIIEYYLLNK